jgi:hypothetical protein
MFLRLLVKLKIQGTRHKLANKIKLEKLNSMGVGF